MISALYGLRMVAAGGSSVSKWLFAFAESLVLSFALTKRVAALGARAEKAYVAQRG